MDIEARIEQAVKEERRLWLEHMKSLGPWLKDAKDEGILDTLIEGNVWPIPRHCITEADIRAAVEEARRLRPIIEAEDRERGGA